MEIKNDIFGEYSAEIAYRIYNANFKGYPFPHAEIGDLLPDPVINKILENWPDSQDFLSNLDSGSIKNFSGTGDYEFRFQINLTQKDHVEKIADNKREIWLSFSKLLCSGPVVRALISLYKVPLLRRFGLSNVVELFNKVDYEPRLQLLHDKTDYSLGPHTDNPKKVMVILIYFDSALEEGSKNTLGTSVYIPKKDGFKCPRGIHHKHEDFIRLYSANFARNNSFSFCRTDNSFHGVEKVATKSVERKLLQYSIFGRPK